MCFAQAKPGGWRCCNVRTAGSWTNDSNHAEDDKTVSPTGTPVKVTGCGRYRVP